MPTGGRAVKSVKSGSANQPVRVERHAAQQVAERGAEEHRQRACWRPAKTASHAARHSGCVDVAAELDRDAAQDERPEHEEDREVEAREPGGEHARERRRTARRRRRAARPRCRPRTGRWRRAPAGAPRRSAPRTGAARRRRSRSRRARRRRRASPRRWRTRAQPWDASASARGAASGAGLERVRAVRDLAADQEEEQQAEHEVQAGEADQREERRARVHASGWRRSAVRMQAVDEPRLAPELGGHPAGGGGDVREREGEHQHPEHRPRSSRAGPRQSSERGDAHQRDEQRAEAGHDVERVVEQLDVVGPVVLGELVRGPCTFAVERPVGEEAEERPGRRSGCRAAAPRRWAGRSARCRRAGRSRSAPPSPPAPPAGAARRASPAGRRSGTRPARSTTRPAIDAEPQEDRARASRCWPSSA